MQFANIMLFGLSLEQFITKRNNNRVLNKLNDEVIQTSFPLLTLKDIQAMVHKHNIAGHLGDEFIKSYKKVYYEAYI